MTPSWDRESEFLIFGGRKIKLYKRISCLLTSESTLIIILTKYLRPTSNTKKNVTAQTLAARDSEPIIWPLDATDSSWCDDVDEWVGCSVWQAWTTTRPAEKIARIKASAPLYFAARVLKANMAKTIPTWVEKFLLDGRYSQVWAYNFSVIAHV